MLHMTGDYYSTIPAVPALWIAAVLVVVLILMVLVGLRRQKVARDRARRLAKYNRPTQPRSTFQAAENMRYGDNTIGKVVSIEPRHRS